MHFEDFFDISDADANAQNEVPVRCPFPHDKGLETRPSAHVNLERRVFHCFVCEAEGREFGMSEASFLSKLHGISYEDAWRMISFRTTHTEETEDEANARLLETERLMAYLAGRGILRETVETYKLGTAAGTEIQYPVFIYGDVLDIRSYNPNPEPGQSKIKSQQGAKPLLFPFDHWRESEGDTLLVAGENDCLLARQLGFNALCVTSGEGAIPRLFLGLFKDRTVHICYDCDEAGRKAARSVAFFLMDAGANVDIVDLGLSGDKADKDITDFVVKHGFGAKELQQRIREAKPFSPDDAVEEKNRHFPLVDLWDVQHGEFSGRRISSRVVMSGKYDMAMEVPTVVQFNCRPDFSDDSPCHKCPRSDENEWYWQLDDTNLDSLFHLVDVSESVSSKYMQQMKHVPQGCPSSWHKVVARKSVSKVIFTPDVETEDILSGFKEAEQYALVLEKSASGHDLEDGNRYRIYFRRYSNPLDNQRIYLIVDKAEDSDNPVNAFRMTPDVAKRLAIFQGDPFDKMSERAKRAQAIIGPFAQDMITWAVDLTYHSPLQFKYNGRTEKGYPEGLIVGESRTGKSETAIGLNRFYGLGNFTACKGATVAGLLGGADKLPSGGHRIKWGKIPRNHRSLVILDEMSGMPTDVMSKLTDMRSSGVATVEKIVGGKAPAATRLLWISNPRNGSRGEPKNIRDFPTGVQMVSELVGSDEDIARFDFCMAIARPSEYASPMAKAEMEAYPREDYRDLIRWIWSRTAEQIVWDEGVEEYVWQVSKELNARYDTNIKFFGAEAWKKLARIAVACAGCCFSTDSANLGDCLYIQKRHVDWAAAFLVRCYDNDLFRLVDYVESKRVYETTTQEVNAIVAGLVKSQPLLMRTLASQTDLSLRQLQAVAGLDTRDFNQVTGTLAGNYLIQVVNEKIMPTRRLRLALEYYRQNQETMEMVPLTKKGFLMI